MRRTFHTADQERDLIVRAQVGDIAARNELVTTNMPLIAHITKKCFSHIQAAGFDFDDLVSVAVLGWMHAIGKVDLSKNLRLSTYACWWIRAFVGRFAHRNRSNIRTPDATSWNDDYKYIDQAHVAHASALNVEQSLHALDNDARGKLRYEQDFGQLERLEEQRAADHALSELDEKHWFVLQQRCKGKTLSEIGEAIGVSRERIRQIEAVALVKLRSCATLYMERQQQAVA